MTARYLGDGRVEVVDVVNGVDRGDDIEVGVAERDALADALEVGHPLRPLVQAHVLVGERVEADALCRMLGPREAAAGPHPTSRRRLPA